MPDYWIWISNFGMFLWTQPEVWLWAGVLSIHKTSVSMKFCFDKKFCVIYKRMGRFICLVLTRKAQWSKLYESKYSQKHLEQDRLKDIENEGSCMTNQISKINWMQVKCLLSCPLTVFFFCILTLSGDWAVPFWASGIQNSVRKNWPTCWHCQFQCPQRI